MEAHDFGKAAIIMFGRTGGKFDFAAIQQKRPTAEQAGTRCLAASSQPGSICSELCPRGAPPTGLPLSSIMKGHVLCRHHAGLDPLPGTFSGLMDLYERNYMLVRRLVPNVAVSGCEYISRVPGNMDLYMRVGERFRFTTELQFTYRFERDEGWVSEPDVLVRIYHDARLAEVMMAHLRRSPAFTAHEFAAGGHIRQRWHVNRFLFKWLGYCVRQGHGFEHLAEREERIG